MDMSAGSHIPSSGPSSGIALELFHGLWKAMIAKTLVELGIPDQLTHSQKTVAELANASETRPELLYRFLRAAAGPDPDQRDRAGGDHVAGRQPPGGLSLPGEIVRPAGGVSEMAVSPLRTWREIRTIALVTLVLHSYPSFDRVALVCCLWSSGQCDRTRR